MSNKLISNDGVFKVLFLVKISLKKLNTFAVLQKPNIKNFTLHHKIGFDGSTGQFTSSHQTKITQGIFSKKRAYFLLVLFLWNRLDLMGHKRMLFGLIQNLPLCTVGTVSLYG